MEQVDQRSRLSNVIIDGMSSESVLDAKTEFVDICTNVLNISSDIVEMRKSPNKKSNVVTLASPWQVAQILAAKDKLKHTQIYMKKDFTKAELNAKYRLRQLGKALSAANKNTKVRFGEFAIYVNDIKYTWFDGNIVATSNKDALSLLQICDFRRTSDH